MDGKEEESYKDDEPSSTTQQPQKQQQQQQQQQQRSREKIVYKIIPVPYYYPVPVDAEWYHQNYEKHYKPGDFKNFPFIDTSTTTDYAPPPPPPGFPFPRYHQHHQHNHFIYEPSSSRRPRSSSPHRKDRDKNVVSPHRRRRLDEDGGAKENGDDAETIREVPINSRFSEATSRSSSSNSSNGNNNNNSNSGNDNGGDDNSRGRRRHRDQRGDNGYDDNVKVEMTNENDDTTDMVVNGNNGRDENRKVLQESNEMESIRDRKRYLMTFPYDQKKKMKMNGHGEIVEHHPHDSFKHAIYVNKDGEPISFHEPGEMHYAHAPHVVPPGHKVPASPYVMVPVQDQQSPYVRTSSNLVHQPLHHTSFVDSEHRMPTNEHSRYTSVAGKLSPEIRDLKKEMEEQRSNENTDTAGNNVKYHPNGRRARTVFTRHQLMTLNNVFEKHHFVSGEKMSELSDELGLDRKIVKIWFQNKRQYSRKKGSLLEKEDDFMNFEYQDFEGYNNLGNNTSNAPTMTMINHGTKSIDDIKKYEENLYKVSVLADDYKPEFSDVKCTPESLGDTDGLFDIEGETNIPVQG